MPLFVQPNSNGEDAAPVDLREFNQCHAPGGSEKGGQFASKRESVCGGGGDTSEYERREADEMLRSATFVQTDHEVGHNVQPVHDYFDSNYLREEIKRTFPGEDFRDVVDKLHLAARRMVQDLDPQIAKWHVRVLSKAGESGVTVSMSITTSEGSISMLRTFTRSENGDLKVHHDGFVIPGGLQGQGIAKSVLRNSLGVYRDMGVKAIETYANIDVGGYAWAKYGFLPTDSPGTAEFATEMIDERVHYSDGAKLKLSVAEARHLRSTVVRNTPNPEWIWSVADTKYNGRSIGKSALFDTGWDARLDLRNHRQVRRFLTYVGALGRKS